MRYCRRMHWMHYYRLGVRVSCLEAANHEHEHHWYEHHWYDGYNRRNHLGRYPHHERRWGSRDDPCPSQAQRR